MKGKPSNAALASGLLLAVILFGANNTGIKYMLGFWPPFALGASRLLLAGWALLALLRWTPLFGGRHPLTPELVRHLWWKTGMLLAVYTVVFYLALKWTAASHVAVYLGASPVWALMWEGKPERHWRSLQRYGAAALGFCGVAILFWPVLHQNSAHLPGELCGLAASILWASFGRQCRAIGQHLSGPEISAHTFWRSGLLLTPFALYELLTIPHIPWRWDLAGIQAFCILGGGVVAFAFWNTALRHWKTSQVLLFNNLVPISMMTWVHFCLGDPFSRTFWISMAFIGTGVALGQANLQRIVGVFWWPGE